MSFPTRQFIYSTSGRYKLTPTNVTIKRNIVFFIYEDLLFHGCSKFNIQYLYLNKLHPLPHICVSIRYNPPYLYINKLHPSYLCFNRIQPPNLHTSKTLLSTFLFLYYIYGLYTK